jgi:hypothetical protein
VNGVPAPTRRLLLLAALEGTGDLHILRSAAAGQHGIGDLASAERAQLVHVDERIGRVAFRHPLIRSAVVKLSTSDERQQVHTALAEQLVDQPERRAWHLADAAVEPDEQVAGLLEQLAHGVRRRGDAVAAIAALLRAAELSQDGSDRSRRLAEAAYFARM